MTPRTDAAVLRRAAELLVAGGGSEYPTTALIKCSADFDQYERIRAQWHADARDWSIRQPSTPASDALHCLWLALMLDEGVLP